MNDLITKYGKTALVTGASAGIGKAFAEKLAELGCDLVLVARRENLLRELAQRLENSYKVKVTWLALDLATPTAIEELDQKLNELKLSIDLLVCNAGYGTFGPFGSAERQRELGMIDLNCRSTVGLCYQFLPAMKTRKKGAIIIVSSVVALAPMPYFATYSATKAFDLVFGEALATELSDTGIDVLTVLPGGTTTEFMQQANVPDLGSANNFRSPQDVVQTALSALGKKPMVIDGCTNNLQMLLTKLLPRRTVCQLMKKVTMRQ